MFTRADAETLRRSLNSFRDADPDSGERLLLNYRRHYGLVFDGLVFAAGDEAGFGLDSGPDGEGASPAISHRIGCFESGDFRLVLQTFAPRSAAPRGTAFLLHGYFDHTGLYGHLIRHCLELGYAVAIFDFPGHGLSSGRVAHIDSFKEYSQCFLDCLELADAAGLAEPWLCVGQSTGGAVIADAIIELGLAQRFALQHYILLAPLLFPVYWRRSKLLFMLTRHFVKRTPRRFALSSHDEEFLRFLREADELQSPHLPREWVDAMIDYQRRFLRAGTQNQALHIIQGTDDGTVDWRKNLPRFLDKFPGSSSTLVEGAKHHLVNESADYREPVFARISELLA